MTTRGDDRGTFPIDVPAGWTTRLVAGGPSAPDDPSVAASVAEAESALERLDVGLASIDRRGSIGRHLRLKEAVSAIRARHPELRLSETELLTLDHREASPGHALGEAAVYARALDHGIAESERSPLSMAMLRELHSLIVSNDPTPDPSGDPGGTPPGADVISPIEALERWHGEQRGRQSIVLVAALAVARLAVIRPFASGNDRLARLVAFLLLAPAFVRTHAPLHPSLYFTRHAPTWRRLLGQVDDAGNAAAWITFFADGIAASARAALACARRLDQLAHDDGLSIQRFGYAGRSAARVHVALQEHPVASIDRLMETSGLHVQAARRALHRLRALDIVAELTHGSRHRIFAYREYVRILGEGTGGD